MELRSSRPLQGGEGDSVVVLVKVLSAVVGFFELIIPVEVREDEDDTQITIGIHRAVVEVRVVMDGNLEAVIAKL